MSLIFLVRNVIIKLIYYLAMNLKIYFYTEIITCNNCDLCNPAENMNPKINSMLE